MRQIELCVFLHRQWRAAERILVWCLEEREFPTSWYEQKRESDTSIHLSWFIHWPHTSIIHWPHPSWRQHTTMHTSNSVTLISCPDHIRCTKQVSRNFITGVHAVTSYSDPLISCTDLICWFSDFTESKSARTCCVTTYPPNHMTQVNIT